MHSIRSPRIRRDRGPNARNQLGFLKVGGTAAGAPVAGGAGVWAASPHVEMPEVSYPGTGDGHGRVLKAMKAPEGDFRNWNAIGSWADWLARELPATA
jgi:hypothetical protein